MKRIAVVCLLFVAFVAGACGAKGDNAATDEEEGGSGVTTTAPTGAAAKTFGDLESPCGPAPTGKTVSIKAEDSPGGTDKLYIGVANDRTSEVQQGLNKELWDASVAFSKWCNDQGGVAGIPIEPVDLDGQAIKVEAAMTTACSKTFAMVGGGFALDTNVFSGKDGSDFHKCKLIAIPGFAVSTEFAGANGVIQPLPNPAYNKSAVFLHDVAEAYPDEVKKSVAVYGEGLPSIAINKDQIKATAAAAVPEMKFLDDISYGLMGQDFSVTAQKIVDSGATAMTFVGEPVNFSSLLFELKAKGWKGISFVDVNEYDQKLFLKGNDVADGVLIRSAFHTYEEADTYPVVKDMVDIITNDGPADPTIAALSMQSFSSNLLFAQAVKDCVANGDGEISRVCVYDAAKNIHEWSAGGLHASGDPGANIPPSCSMIITATADGKFKRFAPKDKKADDGFHCDDSLTVELTGDLGKATIDPSSPYQQP